MSVMNKLTWDRFIEELVLYGRAVLRDDGETISNVNLWRTFKMQIDITLAGASFRPKEAKDYITEQLTRGDECVLERDRHNQYDANAIQIQANGVFIGFVPKTDNSELAAAMDDAVEEGEDFPYTCVCTGFVGTLQPTFTINWGDEEESDDDDSDDAA